MNERMAGDECDQSAGDAADREPDGSAEGNGLGFGIVRVDDIEAVVAQALAQRADASEAHHFVSFGCGALRERAAFRSNDHLTMPALLQASRQRQKQILPASKVLAGVDVSDL